MKCIVLFGFTFLVTVTRPKLPLGPHLHQSAGMEGWEEKCLMAGEGSIYERLKKGRAEGTGKMGCTCFVAYPQDTLVWQTGRRQASKSDDLNFLQRQSQDYPKELRNPVGAWEDLALNRPSWRSLVSRRTQISWKRCRATAVNKGQHGKRDLLANIYPASQRLKVRNLRQTVPHPDRVN